MNAMTHLSKSGKRCRIVSTGPHDYGVVEWEDGRRSNYPPSRLRPIR